MGAVFGAYSGLGSYLIQSGLYTLCGLSRLVGRLAWCVYLPVFTLLHDGCLSEYFLAFPEVFTPKALPDLFVFTLCGSGCGLADTVIRRICRLCSLAELQERGPYFSTGMVMDYISSLLLTTLCMMGGTLTVVLKEWMIDNQRVAQMEKAHMLSEVELLKEQISPELLFNTLHRSGQLTQSEPEEASRMLMKLSQLLRYQLYDCSRTKVLLGSEITFLTNYLTLEQSSQSRFDYTCTSEGEVNRVLVPPLLFIPFVQHAIKLINEQQRVLPVTLRIKLKAEKDKIQFTCACSELDLSVDRGLERISQRLNLLYGNRYRLTLAAERIQLELEGGEA